MRCFFSLFQSCDPLSKYVHTAIILLASPHRQRLPTALWVNLKIKTVALVMHTISIAFLRQNPLFHPLSYSSSVILQIPQLRFHPATRVLSSPERNESELGDFSNCSDSVQSGAHAACLNRHKRVGRKVMPTENSRALRLICGEDIALPTI